MRLVDKTTGEEVKIGSKVTTFRGEEYILTAAYPPGTSQGGRGEGKIQVATQEEVNLGLTGSGPLYYAGVIGAKFVE